jgi:hypothetical protein
MKPQDHHIGKSQPTSKLRRPIDEYIPPGSVTIRTSANVSGRDAQTVGKALAYAIVAIQRLPERQREKSDQSDMMAILQAWCGLGNAAHYLRNAIGHTDPKWGTYGVDRKAYEAMARAFLLELPGEETAEQAGRDTEKLIKLAASLGMVASPADAFSPDGRFLWEFDVPAYDSADQDRETYTLADAISHLEEMIRNGALTVDHESQADVFRLA